MNDLFKKIATKSSEWMGHPWAFVGSCLACVLWAGSGPLFDYSDTWQLVINTATTVVTFLMVFLVQNTQNRDTLAIQLKLDELIRSSSAHNKMIDLDDLSDAELKKLHAKYVALGKKDAAEETEEELEDRRKE